MFTLILLLTIVLPGVSYLFVYYLVVLTERERFEDQELTASRLLVALDSKWFRAQPREGRRRFYAAIMKEMRSQLPVLGLNQGWRRIAVEAAFALTRAKSSIRAGHGDLRPAIGLQLLLRRRSAE